ncbi:MAG: IS5 family transposase, partial [Clostridiales bacterium]|nr:IS5 family transposase [Clostridiales bacterium]
MELTKAAYSLFEHLMPKPRGSLTISHYDALRAILYVAENGCKWRKLPREYGNWHTVYTRMMRWCKNGVLAKVFAALRQEGVMQIHVKVVSLDSTSIKVHPDKTGALKKRSSVHRKIPGGWNTKLHLVAADDRTAVSFMLSRGECHDAPQSRSLLESIGSVEQPCFLLMDRAYEDNQTREMAASLGYKPVVPPKRNRIDTWDYDAALYKCRNEVERLFRKLKGFRRVFTRYDKLDVIFLGFVTLALV